MAFRKRRIRRVYQHNIGLLRFLLDYSKQTGITIRPDEMVAWRNNMHNPRKYPGMIYTRPWHRFLWR